MRISDCVGGRGVQTSWRSASVVLALVVATTPAAIAQSASIQAAPDSAETLDRAHDAQRRFERLRVRHLPWSWGGWSGPCDERVGRMCWHHDDPEDDWVQPAEPEELIRERDALIDTLAALAQILPGDRWILAQQVWYLGEADRWDEAANVTGSCTGGDRRWCSALRGLALHEQGMFVEATQAFDEAGDIIDEMGGDGSEALRTLFDGQGRDLLDADRPAQAPERLSPDSLMWLLADPLYVVPGNDRRTEHAARRVVDRIRDGARNPYSLSWGKDLTELVIRYGWAVAWERVRGTMGSSEPRSIMGRHPSKGRGFVPGGDVLEMPEGATPSELEPVARRPRTTYRPRYASVIRPAEAEVFALDRGDSIVFIGAFTQELADTMPARAGAFAAGLQSGEVVEGRRIGSRSWTITSTNAPHVVSLEHLPESSAPPDSAGLALRHRRAFPASALPEGVVSLSELMFLNEGTEPATLDDVARALRSPRLAPGQTITVAWEVYGLGFDDVPVGYEVLLGRKRKGLLATVGGWVGLGDGGEGLLIDWVEAQPEDPGPQLRYVSVTFPQVEEGIYILGLAVRLAGRAEVVREREFEVSLSR